MRMGPDIKSVPVTGISETGKNKEMNVSKIRAGESARRKTGAAEVSD